MSAIWGAISFTNKKLPEEIPTVFRRAFKSCVLDRVEEVCDDMVYMGCGIQYITKEAEIEKLPKQEGTVWFTADVVLDNRENLMQQSDRVTEGTMTPDGDILFRVFRDKRQDVLNELLGAYAFVYYDRKQQEANLVIDAVGERMMYYTVYEGVLYFSSLLMPLAELTGAKLNDRWITDFLAMDHLFMINETEETPFQNIFRVAPACAVKVTARGVEKYQYWNPAKTVKTLRLKTDEEYKEAFRKVFFGAVESKIRRNGPLSALLSGGFDSTAVVSVAARLLKEQGQKIISFTSVPLKGYQGTDDGYYVEDETDLVEKTVDFLGNVEAHYIDLPGVNPWNAHEECMKRMEMPYKSSLNLLWIYESMKQARERGARVMLTGSYGNTSISYTNVEVYLRELRWSGHFLRYNKELKAFAGTYEADAKVLKARLRKTKKYRENRRWAALYKKSFVRPSMIAETDGDVRMLRLNRSVAESGTHKKQRESMMNELSLRQIGEITEKNSLATGVLLRDPTKDKRVIEFCMSLPPEQFNKNGEIRRLVSQYLREYLPSHIFEKLYQGKQSADFVYRLSLDWENIRRCWMERCRQYANSRYADAGLAYVQLKKQADISEYTQMDLTRHVYTQMVMEYEHAYGKHRSEAVTASESLPLISVIIPVYNCEKYLERCVESVLRQTYKELEIILVDDGSTDQSGRICDRYAETDHRVKVLHCENGGVARARNAALEIATGEYVGFVDGDDFIYPTMYEVLSENIRKYRVPVAGCGVECINYDGEDITNCQEFTFLYHGAEMLETALGYGRRTTSVAISVWNKLFKKSFLEPKRFMEVGKYEDLEFVWSLLGRTSGAVFVDQPLYHYEMRKEGLHNQKRGSRELTEFVRLEQSVLDMLKMNPAIRKEGYWNHLLYVHTRVTDWLLSGKNSIDRKSRKVAARSLWQRRKDIREAILKTPGMRKKEKIVCYSGVYSVKGAQLLKKIMGI